MRFFSTICFFIFLCTQLVQAQQFLKGADLSFANELQNPNECGIKYQLEPGENSPTKDVYEIFKQYGCNVVRARLWVGNSNLVSGTYSNIADVKKTFENAKKNSPWVKTLLTIHYSDTWADPKEQKTPRPWSSYTYNTVYKKLRDRVWSYTVQSINQIGKGKIDYIAIGNETNAGFICPTADNNCNNLNDPERYNRMKELLQIGINAARNRGFAKDNIMVHVAGPGNAWWWLDKMNVGRPGGLNDFGLIGLSYYPALPIIDRDGHNMSTEVVGRILKNIIGKHRVRPIIVETSHPYTAAYTRYDPNNDKDTDKQNRMSSSTSYEKFKDLIPKPWKQKVFMERLTNQTYNAGGLGVISWEPAWVSPAKGKNECVKSSFGYGSDQEHHTFFSLNNQHSVVKNGGISFMNLKKNYNVLGFRDVVFRLNIASLPAGQTPHLAVDFDGNDVIDYGNWHNERVKMTWDSANQVWTATTSLRQGVTYKYRYMNGYNPNNAEQLSGSNCTNGQAIRQIKVWNGAGKQIVKNWYGGCYTSQSWSAFKANGSNIIQAASEFSQDFAIAPNPAKNSITVQSKASKIIKNITIQDITGKQYNTYYPNAATLDIDISALQKGIYIVIIDTGQEKASKKLIVQ
ncbi:glycosyl hydrolase 53 family protein [uncultured Maribacter sp.]|uniref:glycosyl hydrolase 53 family protein n=1 Tax=uncultured Maribacter sp. TaxID=431308 RepID=UPI0026153765|nr:glycosyl hydrolase 53 family protein [uncultured Maribacter sp.]